MRKTITFILGKEIEDKITGFKGTVTAEIFYLNGCHRVFVTPRCTDNKTNEKPEEEVFDRLDVTVLELKKEPAKKPNHGPRGRNEKKLCKM